MISGSTEAGSTKDYNFPWEAKQNETKLDVSYASLEENQGLKEVCNHLSI